MKYKKIASVLSSLALVCCDIASAAPLDDAWKYYDESNFNKAAEVFRALKPMPPQVLGVLCQMAVMKSAISDFKNDFDYCNQAVAANDPNGLTWLGLAYLRGNTHLEISKEPVLGLGYLGKAVIARYPIASNVLCDYFYRESMFGKAAPFCKVAATSNLAGGLYRLALMSVDGKGTIQDFEKGRSFALLSASLNSYDAYMLLGDIAKSGNYGKPKDFTAAYAWYVLAGAAAPDSDKPREARDSLGLDAEKIATAQKVAAGWKKSQPTNWRSLYPSVAVADQSRAQPSVEAKALSPASSASLVVSPALSKSWAPSFDCSKVSTDQERLICSTRELSEVDVKLSNVYKAAYSASNEKVSFKATQTSWRKNSRDICSDVICMLAAYESRISELSR